MPTPPVRVVGLEKTRRAILKAGATSDDLRDLMGRVGKIVANAARPRAPIGPTGRLAASIRFGRAKSSARVRAGSASVPYAGPVHWGWANRNIRPQPFLTDALTAERPRVIREFTQGVDHILKHSHLK
jgi:hypothetical protein